ncbi:MAG: HAMP domain-containing protein, partial [Actinobacteria bacterium]|nr:HAMP domain-containing protein [Actinomycetota bacterium]
MGVRRRLQIVLAVVLLALVIFAVLVGSRLALVSSSGSVVTNQVQPSVRTASDIALNILDVDLTASRYALTQAVSARNENAVADNLVRSGLRSLSGTAQGDERTRQASEKLETTYLDWFTTVISPTMSATSASQRAKAREAAASTAAAKQTDALRANLSALQTILYLWRTQATDDTARSLTILKSALAVSLIGILLLVLVLRWGLRRWVTQPLIDVAADLRQVADGDTTHQIRTTGPAEIAQTAQDAEDMRRRLMREIDEAIAAREALDQRGPVVAALRRELQGRVTA